MPRYNAAKDANKTEITDALRAAGATVRDVKGPGIPDLLAGYRGHTYLLEVKRPLGPRGGSDGRNLTPAQQKLWDEWRGAPFQIVRSIQQALEAIGAVKPARIPPPEC